MLTNYVYPRVGMKTLIRCLVVLLIFSIPSVAVADGRMVITGATEDTIIVKDQTYQVAAEARIYNQDGERISMDQFPAPCVAKIMFEPRQGQKVPVVMVINVIKVLPDPAVPRNRMSKYPE